MLGVLSGPPRTARLKIQRHMLPLAQGHRGQTDDKRRKKHSYPKVKR